MDRISALFQRRVADAHGAGASRLEDMAPAFAHGSEPDQPLAGRWMQATSRRRPRLPSSPRDRARSDGVVKSGFGVFRAGEQAAAMANTPKDAPDELFEAVEMPERAFAPARAAVELEADHLRQCGESGGVKPGEDG